MPAGTKAEIGGAESPWYSSRIGQEGGGENRGWNMDDGLSEVSS